MSIIEKLGITPGPWTIAGGHYLIGNCEDIAIQIAIFDKDDDWEKEQTANKNIILSSPEMLEALIEEAQYPLEDGSPNWTMIGIVEKATGKSWEEIKQIVKDR